MTGIFAEFAPQYWAAGIQAIPLKPRQKSPAEGNWNTWNVKTIPDQLKASWLTRYAEGNIGVPAGPASNICFIDIDTFDDRLLKAIEDAVPVTPWRRVGQKGCVLAYRYNGAKSFKIRSEDIGVEFFGTSGQIVLPPSIHPDTQKPYVSNSNLWEVYDQLPDLTTEIETVLRTALRKAGVVVSSFGHSRLIDKVSKGARDNTMIHLCGALAFEIKRGKITLMDAFQHIEFWADNSAESVSGDEIDVGKGKARIVQFLIRDVHERKVSLPRGWDDGVTPELRAELGLDAISEDDISLDHDEIQRRFLEELQGVEDRGGSDGMKLQVAEKTLTRIARSQTLNAIQSDALISLVIKSMPKNSINRASVGRYLRSVKTEGIEGTNHAEIAQAVLEDFPDIKLRFAFETLWQWCSSHWAPMNRSDIIKHIIENYGHMPAARKHNDYVGIYKAMAEKVHEPLRKVDLRGINFSNGFLTSDLRMMPHDPDFGMTYEMPYEYRPELATKPVKFLDFLNSSFEGDQSMVDVVQEAIAVTLFGMAPKFARCFLLHGVPHSGKSAMLEIISSLVPPVVRCTVPPHRMNERFLIAQLHGKLMNFAGELPENRSIESSTFKGIVTGDPISGEYKNKDVFTFSPDCAHWFASNHLPKTNDISSGFLRRWLVIPFNKAVPEAERNVNLADEIILHEREAIVAWAVQAIGRVMQRNRLTVPKSSLAMLEEMGAAINPIRTWLRERTSKVDGNVLEEEHAYSDYSHFSLLKGYKRLERPNFRITMREKAAEDGNFQCIVGPDGVQKYVGLRLKTAK